MAPKKDIISPSNIAKYFLIRAEKDGVLISPLKMQKLVYYAYVIYLLRKRGKKKLFIEGIQAWPAGPVVPSLYGELKKYGSMPIDAKDYVNIDEKSLKEQNPEDVIELLDDVYETCERFTPFELVLLTHQEKSWINAREGLSPNEPSKNVILDKDILKQHLK